MCSSSVWSGLLTTPPQSKGVGESFQALDPLSPSRKWDRLAAEGGVRTEGLRGALGEPGQQGLGTSGRWVPLTLTKTSH